MRKLVSSLFVSLDGVIDNIEEWQFDFDDEMAAELTGQTKTQDAVLLGRVTYQEFAEFWPNETEDDFADFINNTPKYVISTTLETAEWANTTVLRGNLEDEVRRLKNESGRDIGVQGSMSVVRSLLDLNLLDELTLMVHPVIAGTGTRLFPDGTPLTRLQLLRSKQSSTGTAILTYAPHPGTDD